MSEISLEGNRRRYIPFLDRAMAVLKLQARSSLDLELRPIKLDEILQNSPPSLAPDGGDGE